MSETALGVLLTVGSFGGVAACAVLLSRISRRNERTFTEWERRGSHEA